MDKEIEQIFEELEYSEYNLPNKVDMQRLFKSKSAQIRYLHYLEIPQKVIAGYLNLRPQHVYNVIKGIKPSEHLCPVCQGRGSI